MTAFRRGTRRRSVVLLLLVTSITLITLDQRGGDSGVIGEVRDRARDVVAPMQRVVDDAFSPIDEWIDGARRGAEIERENRRLREELSEARGRAASGAAARRDVAALRKLAGLTFVPGEVETVVAQVVGATPGNFEFTVEIDRGSTSGVRSGMPVVAGDGLVGRVDRVYRHRSTVLLITDPSSGVGVRLADSGVPGVAQGRAGRTELALEFVDPTTDVEEGELVVTSGLEGSAFPPGIPVARVSSVSGSDRALEKRVLLRPLVDFPSTSLVKVLLWSPPGAQP